MGDWPRPPLQALCLPTARLRPSSSVSPGDMGQPHCPSASHVLGSLCLPMELRVLVTADGDGPWFVGRESMNSFPFDGQ